MQETPRKRPKSLPHRSIKKDRVGDEGEGGGKVVKIAAPNRDPGAPEIYTPISKRSSNLLSSSSAQSLGGLSHSPADSPVSLDETSLSSPCSPSKFNSWLNELLGFSKRMASYGFGIPRDLSNDFHPADSPFYDEVATVKDEGVFMRSPVTQTAINPMLNTIHSMQSSHSRMCISCGVSKTPYWRDSWAPNLYLCNACGLRYAKFKKHCSRCGYVPRKDNKGGRVCPHCESAWS